MKNLFLLFTLIPVLFSCENKRDVVLEFFDELGVQIEMDKRSQCLYKQLENIYEEANTAENIAKIALAVSKKNIYKINLTSKEETAITCKQIVIHSNVYVTELTCDPNSQSGTKAKLKPTSVDYDNGNFSLEVNFQNHKKIIDVFEFPEVKEDEIADLEFDLTTKQKGRSFVDIKKIQDYVTSNGTSIRRVEDEEDQNEIVTSARCGALIGLKEIFHAMEL